MSTSEKNWDHYVVAAEEVARGDGFVALRDLILAYAEPRAGEVAVDVGSGTGLLTLPLAAQVEKVWAVDIAAPMCRYLSTKAASADLDNIDTATASAVSLPLVDGSAELVVSNYCFHHLDDADKRRALAEVMRVLRPGGRLVFGDMMFRVSVADPRDRRVVAAKVRLLLRQGPRGLWRLVKNFARFAGRRWEQPARSDWWESALREAGFVDVEVEVLEHEGGIARAHKPSRPTITPLEPRTAGLQLLRPMTDASPIQGELQRQVMTALWRIDEGSVEQVWRAIPGRYRGACTTVQVGLNRLADRGLVVRRRQGDVIIYRPGLSEAEYLSRSIENALSGATPEARRLALAQVVGGPPGDELSGVRPMAGRITGERKAR